MEEKNVGAIFGLVEGSIPKFSGDDKTRSSLQWALDIEENAAIFGWTEQQRLIMARRSLTGTAALWLRTEKIHKTYEELKAAVIKEFPELVNSKEMHEIMTCRKKRRDETYYQYMLTMKELGKRAKFPDYIAIQYIIDGIVDTPVNKTILLGVTTYAALKEKLNLYEEMKKAQASMDKTSRSFISHKTASTSKRCYNCGDYNHVAAACTSGVKCFRCNQFGHIGRHCTQDGGFRNRSDKKAFSGQASSIGGRHHKVGSIAEQQRKPPNEGASTSRQVYYNSAQDGATGNHSEVYVASVNDMKLAQRESFCNVGSIDGQAIGRSIEMTPQNKNNDGGSIGDFGVYNVNKNSKHLVRPVKPLKNVIFCGKKASALVDSGCDVNLISDEFLNELCLNKYDVNTNIILTGLGFTKVKSYGAITLNIVIDNCEYAGVKFYVISKDTMPFKVILGNDFLCKTVMFMKDSSVWFMPKDEEWLGCLMSNCDDVIDFPCLGHLKNPMIRQAVRHLVSNYYPQQIREAPVQMKIVVKDDIPVRFNPRRISLMEQSQVEKQVEEWLDKKIIRVSYSEYCSPLVLVRKKCGSLRICIDYRKLNNKILKDEFPLPLIEDYIDKLCDARVFSLLDLKDGFFHLRVCEESIKYTAFVTHHGQFEFLRAPFGLSICPNYFMRFITIIFREIMAKGWLMIFIDDILITAENENQALDRLKEVMTVASEYGLQINWKKAELIKKSITFLGHRIENGEVQPSAEKIEAVMKFPEPRTVKQIQSFIGLASYFRKYIQNFALIASPLTTLLKKDVPFVFDQKEREAFYILKEKLTRSPVLKIFNPRLQTELHTDASSHALAAILMQRDEKGDLHPVYFMSRKTNTSEEKYSSYELEAMAVILGVKKFRHYLFGLPFKIVTDCKAFELTLKKKDLTPKVARWAMMLQEFNFVIEHRAGTQMRHVDALTRYPYAGVVTTIHDNLRTAQENDEALRAITTIVKEKPYQDYWIDNGLLYKGNDKTLVVPQSMELSIIENAHSNGHFSVKKTIESISKNYHIRNVEKKVQEYISACIPCLLAVNKAGKKEGFLHVIDKGDMPLHTIHLDHIGPMCETKKQYNYILTAVDGFTKFVWLFPTKGLSTKEVIDKLKLHQQNFGNPGRFITDRGTAYTSQEFNEYCKEQGIEHIKITTGVPRSNGQVERVHRTVIAVLTKLCIETPSLWYKHVSAVQRALNSTYHRSVNTTPFELLLGVSMKNVNKELYDLIQQEEIDCFTSQREELRKKAKEQILKVQEENSKNFNKGRKESIKYNLNDLVAIKRTQYGVCMKLKPKFLGPYRISKVKRNDRYDVVKADPNAEGPNKTSTSADFMKPWPHI